jgi:hypothetical protein
MRTAQEQLENKVLWRSRTREDDREQVFERTGTRFVVLDEMPGWNGCSQSPIDAMHNFYIGMVGWIAKQILGASGLLDTRRRTGLRTLSELFDGCLDDGWFPDCYSRLPPKVCSY